MPDEPAADSSPGFGQTNVAGWGSGAAADGPPPDGAAPSPASPSTPPAGAAVPGTALPVAEDVRRQRTRRIIITCLVLDVILMVALAIYFTA